MAVNRSFEQWCVLPSFIFQKHSVGVSGLFSVSSSSFHGELTTYTGEMLPIGLRKYVTAWPCINSWAFVPATFPSHRTVQIATLGSQVQATFLRGRNIKNEFTTITQTPGTVIFLAWYYLFDRIFTTDTRWNHSVINFTFYRYISINTSY